MAPDGQVPPVGLNPAVTIRGSTVLIAIDGDTSQSADVTEHMQPTWLNGEDDATTSTSPSSSAPVHGSHGVPSGAIEAYATRNKDDVPDLFELVGIGPVKARDVAYMNSLCAVVEESVISKYGVSLCRGGTHATRLTQRVCCRVHLALSHRYVQHQKPSEGNFQRATDSLYRLWRFVQADTGDSVRWRGQKFPPCTCGTVRAAASV